MNKLVKCKKCKLIHFEYSEEEHLKYGAPTQCFRCRNTYKDFEDVSDRDIDRGHTIQGILNRDK